MHIHAPLFRVVHHGIPAIVYTTLGQACSIVVRGLRQYSTFNSAKVNINISEHNIISEY